MPLYEYECLKCGERFEIIQKFSDEPVRLHAENGGSQCSGSVRKLLAAPAIRFKGSGWYVTDYGKAGKKPSGEAGEPSSKTEAKSLEAADSAAKPKKPASDGKDSKPSKRAASVA